MKISYLSGMNISASGLAAQRMVMDAAAENLANAQTTRTESGGPYRRKLVPLTSEPVQFTVQEPAAGPTAPLTRTDPNHLEPNEPPVESQVELQGVTASVTEDQTPFPTVYDPGHPDADAQGMVKLPNVDTAHEMVTLLVASRAYEANIAALQSARRLADATLNLAR